MEATSAAIALEPIVPKEKSHKHQHKHSHREHAHAHQHADAHERHHHGPDIEQGLSIDARLAAKAKCEEGSRTFLICPRLMEPFNR